VEHAEVWANADAANDWCGRATEYEEANDGKPWRKVPIPVNAVQ